MAELAAIIGAIGSAAGSAAGSTLATIGSITGGVGTVLSGVAANRSAQFEAAQMEAKGKEEVAAAQRDAQEKRREGDLVMSRQQALAAASGAGASTPTIIKLMTDTAGQADYNARAVMYGGESRKRGLFDSAAARRRSGRASLLGSFIGGFGEMAKGFG